MVEKVDQYTVKVTFKKPTPFWADAFVGTRGMLIPKHLFADFIGAKSRDAPTNLKPVGTGPYMFKDFKPGDLVTGVANPNYHQANKPYLRLGRDEGRRRRRLGGARGAADRRIRLRLEPAGRGRNPPAPGEGRQGQGLDHAGRQHRVLPAEHDRSVDRGRRRAVEPEDQASDAQRSGSAQGDRRCWSTTSRSRSTSTAAPARRRATSSTARRASIPRTTRSSSTSTRPTTSSRRPAGRRAPTASAPRTARSSSSSTRPRSTSRARRRRPSSSRRPRRPASTSS